MATIPSQFRAGDYVAWTEADAPESTTAITVYLRTRAASGAAIAASDNGNGTFDFAISSVTSAALTAGDYLAQFLATVDGQPQTYREVRFSVLASLAYTGSPGSFDPRSQAEKDLEAVEEAIRVLAAGAQEYRIGTGTANGGRMVRRADLADLIAWRDRLKAEVAKEQAAADIENGKGNPNSLFVRFTPSF
jgi:hypothetical protein